MHHILILSLLISITSALPCLNTVVTYTTTTGSFESNAVGELTPNHANCQFLIKPTNVDSHDVIVLDFTRFETERLWDWVHVYDGETTTSPLIASLNDKPELPSRVVSTGNVTLVVFTSDEANKRPGFAANYTTIRKPDPQCQSKTVLTASSGEFNDGSSEKSDYQYNLKCAWLIETPAAGMVVTFTFKSFDISSGNDYIYIYDGNTTNSPLLRSLTGSLSIPYVVQSTGPQLYVKFTTNALLVAPGWLANYTIAPKQHMCASLTTLRNDTGIFTDGSTSTGLYGYNIDCSWHILPESIHIYGLVTHLTITRFASENGRDILRIHDGASVASPLLQQLTGTPALPVTLTAMSGQVFLRFTSDSQVSMSGWQANWTAIEGTSQCSSTPKLLTNNTGILSSISFNITLGTVDDGSGPLDYQRHLDCNWWIRPMDINVMGIKTDVTFSHFNTNHLDYLEIYDGNSSSSSLLLNVSGSPAVPFMVTSNSGQIWLHFVTGGDPSLSGWTLSYAATTPYPQCGNSVLVNQTGSLEDGSMASQTYQYGLNCYWYINPKSSTTVAIVLTFLKFSTEPDLDVVKIWNGNSTDGILLKTVSGNPAVPFSIFSTMPSMVVGFSTNVLPLSSYPGWQATYIGQDSGIVKGTPCTNCHVDPLGTDDDGCGIGVGVSACKSIGYTLRHRVSDGGTVNIASGIFFESNIYVTDKCFTMKGSASESTVLNAEEIGRVIWLHHSTPYSSACWVFQDLGFVNGLLVSGEVDTSVKVSSGGGAMLLDGDVKVEITNCIFGSNRVINNIAPQAGFGGAIAAIMARVSISKSRFVENHAPNGGAIFVMGDLSVEASTMTSNNASVGGAIAVRNGSVEINDVTASNNMAMSGGVVHVNGDKVVVTGGSYTKNSAVDNGGAVWIKASSLWMTNATYRDNSGKNGGAVYVSADRLDVNHTLFTGNMANQTGGGINVDSATSVSFNGIVFDGNRASLSGGAAAIMFDATPKNHLTIENSNFLGNREGGLHICYTSQSSGDVVSLINSTFALNLANKAPGGGALVVEYKDTTVKSFVSIHGVSFKNNAAMQSGPTVSTAGGGAITVVYMGMSTDTSVALTDSHGTFNQNVQGVCEGGFMLIRYVGIATGNRLTMTESSALNSLGGTAAIAVRYEEHAIDNLVDIGSSIIRDSIGGGIMFDFRAKSSGNVIDFHHAIISTNTRSIGSGIRAIFSQQSLRNKVILNNTHVSGNAASSFASVLLLYSNGSRNDDITFQETMFSGNDGGPTSQISFMGSCSDSRVKLVRAIYSSNSGSSGGGFSLSFTGTGSYKGNTIAVTDAVFDSNKALHSTAGYGGAISVVVGSVESVVSDNRIDIDSTMFNSNEAGVAGGGLFVSCGGNVCSNNTIMLNNVEIRGSKAKWGAGLTYLMPKTTLQNLRNVLHVTNSTFCGNRAGSLGGAIVVSSEETQHTDLQFSNVVIRNNSAVSACGGVALFVWSGDRPIITLVDSIIDSNTVDPASATSPFGGGLYVSLQSTTSPILRLTQCNVTRNIASIGAGVLVIQESTADSKIILDSPVILANTADRVMGGVGLVSVSTRMTDIQIIDAVIENNSVGETGAGIYIYAHSTFNEMITIIRANASRNHAASGMGGVVFMDRYQEIEASSLRIETLLAKQNSAGIAGGVLALRMQPGFGAVNVSLASCTFIDNQADRAGGGIYSEGPSSIHVDTHAARGNTAYDGGELRAFGAKSISVVNSREWDVMGSNTSTSTSIRLDDCSTFTREGVLVCPAGTLFSAQDTGFFSNELGDVSKLATFSGIGKNSSYPLESWTLHISPSPPRSSSHVFNVTSCIPCPVGSYSLEISTSQSNTSLSSFCLACATGALCNGGSNMSAIHGYYALVTHAKRRIAHFHRCSPDYCIGTRAPMSCTLNRTGPLCGDCLPGYSLGLYSSMCVRDSECGLDAGAVVGAVLGSVALLVIGSLVFVRQGQGEWSVMVFFFSVVPYTLFFIRTAPGTAPIPVLEPILFWFIRLLSLAPTIPTSLYDHDCPISNLDATTKLGLQFFVPVLLFILISIILYRVGIRALIRSAVIYLFTRKRYRGERRRIQRKVSRRPAAARLRAQLDHQDTFEKSEYTDIHTGMGLVLCVQMSAVVLLATSLEFLHCVPVDVDVCVSM